VERILLDQVIETDYGQFDLAWDGGIGFDGDFDRVFDGQVNGLVGAAHPGGVYVNLAQRWGGSPMRIVLCDSPPDDEPSYQDVVEVSVEIPPAADIRWMSWAAENQGVLSGVAAGAYRLRVSARDRDLRLEHEFGGEMVNAYLLQLWPTPAAPDVIVRVGSKDAEYWHREVGSQAIDGSQTRPQSPPPAFS
jgi:hypothetical protein